MSVTRLKRKHRKNIARANNEVKKIKNLLRTPVLKNVDLDELKSRFGQTAPAAAEAEKKNSEPGVKEESLLDKVRHAASDALDAVTHSSVVESVKEAAGHAVDAVTHSGAFEAVQEAAHNLVEGTKHVLGADAPQAAASEPTSQDPAATNQTGTEGFDEAEAVTKPVNEDGQEGEHPKPEIHL